MLKRFENFSNRVELALGRLFFRDTSVRLHRKGGIFTATGLEHVWGSEPMIGQHVFARPDHIK